MISWKTRYELEKQHFKSYTDEPRGREADGSVSGGFWQETLRMFGICYPNIVN